MRYDVRHIDIISLVRTVFVVAWVTCLLLGVGLLLLLAVIMSVVANTLGNYGIPLWDGWYPGLGLTGGVLVTAIGATIGAAVSTGVAAIFAVLYNVIAGSWGGVKLEIEEVRVLAGSLTELEGEPALPEESSEPSHEEPDA